MASVQKKIKTSIMNKCLKYSIVISALGFSFQCAAQGAQLTSQLDKVCQSKEQKIEDVYENGALTQCYFKGRS